MNWKEAPMRRGEKSVDEAQAFEIMDRAEYGVLSTVCQDGQPYGVPMSHVVMDGRIYFHCARGAGLKLFNIASNPAVSYTAVASTKTIPEKITIRFESAVAFGVAREVDGDVKIQALMALVKKYAPSFKSEGEPFSGKNADKTAVVEIEVARITGKVSNP